MVLLGILCGGSAKVTTWKGGGGNDLQLFGVAMCVAMHIGVAD